MSAAVVDLFCGIGGLSHGFYLEKFDVRAGYDVDESCRYSYEANNGGAKFVGTKIEDVTPEQIQAHYPEDTIRVLVGCAPCQPFSSYSNTLAEKDKDKWGLLYHFSELVEHTLPHVVSMENVPRLAHFKEKPVLLDFVNLLRRLDYHVWYDVVQCTDYGLPQSRSRLVLLASRLGSIELAKPHHRLKKRTVKDAIGKLPKVDAGAVHAEDLLHRAFTLSELNLARIQASKPGGTWRDWPVELRSPCHTRDSGKFYSSVYGRMSWDQAAPTITTQFYSFGSGRFGHPEQDRAITLREAALLQTFPRNYKFSPTDSKSKITFLAVGRQIGNAVPVDLARVIARSIKKHIEKHAPDPYEARGTKA